MSWAHHKAHIQRLDVWKSENMAKQQQNLWNNSYQHWTVLRYVTSSPREDMSIMSNTLLRVKSTEGKWLNEEDTLESCEPPSHRCGDVLAYCALWCPDVTRWTRDVRVGYHQLYSLLSDVICSIIFILWNNLLTKSCWTILLGSGQVMRVNCHVIRHEQEVMGWKLSPIRG